MAKSAAKRRTAGLSQYGSARTANSFLRPTTEAAIENAGTAACPTKYPVNARKGIAASIARRRTGAPKTCIADWSLNFLSACTAFE